MRTAFFDLLQDNNFSSSLQYHFHTFIDTSTTVFSLHTGDILHIVSPVKEDNNDQATAFLYMTDSEFAALQKLTKELSLNLQPPDTASPPATRTPKLHMS